MVKQQRSTSQSGRHCLGVERPNIKRHLATGKSHGDNARTRWRNTSRKGKNGLRHVRAPQFRSRKRFFSVVFFRFFFAPVLGNVSYPLPTNWCTDDIDNISAYSFRANFKEDDKRLQSIDATENPWCPLCALPACCQCYCNFHDDSNKPPNCNKNLTLLSNNVKLRRALLTND